MCLCEFVCVCVMYACLCMGHVCAFVCVLVCMCVMCAYLCMPAMYVCLYIGHACIYIYEGQRRMSGILLHHSPSYFLRNRVSHWTRSLLSLISVRLTHQQAPLILHSSDSLYSRTEVTWALRHPWFLTWVLGMGRQVLMRVRQFPLSPEPSYHPSDQKLWPASRC